MVAAVAVAALVWKQEEPYSIAVEVVAERDSKCLWG